MPLSPAHSVQINLINLMNFAASAFQFGRASSTRSDAGEMP
jgi:hypothetical protein